MADRQLYAIPAQSDAFDPENDSVLVTDGTTVAGSGKRKPWEIFDPGLAAEAGTTITLAKATHFGRVVKAGNAGAITLTIPPDLPSGGCTVIQTLAGQITVAPGMGVTLRYPASGGLKSSEQWGSLVLLRLAANEWWVAGGVA